MSTEFSEAEKLMESLHRMVRRRLNNYISPLDLRKMYRLYSKWRDFVKNRNCWLMTGKENRRIRAFDRYLVHYLLERCYWSQYGDSDMVADLLSILYTVDGNLGKIFHFRNYSTDSTYLFGDMSETDSDSEEEGEPSLRRKINDKYFYRTTWRKHEIANLPVKPIDYFMNHAYKKRLLFGTKRFAEQSIVVSAMEVPVRNVSLLYLRPCSQGFPQTLLQMLRVGLFTHAGPNDPDVGRLLTAALGSSPGSSTALRAYQMLLRAVERVDPCALARAQRLRASQVPRLVQELRGVLPMLARRCAASPQDLTHLCRCAIRRRLYDNWQLPGGITFLPLPTLLKRYLRLELD